MSVSPLLVCGPSSPPCNLSIGTVTTGAAGSPASATVTGIAPNQTLNLSIPAGEAGPRGPVGGAGPNVLDTGTTSPFNGYIKGNGATLSASTSIPQADVTGLTTALAGKESTANKNQANGYAGLDGTGLVPSALLPSYVDDVLEFATLAAFPGTGETGKIYVALNTGKIYRWSGSAYVEISPSPGSTDSVTEGATNLYFTEARVRATVLTGLVAAAVLAAPVATDSLMVAWGKVAKLFSSLGSAAYLNTGTTTNTVAAGDDSRFRGVLTGALTLYVRTDGNDSNNGLANTAGGAFATLQAAYNAAARYDTRGWPITIQIADGTYAPTGSVLTVDRTLVGVGYISIVGNTIAPGNVILNPTNGHCFDVFTPGIEVRISGVRMQTPNGWYPIQAWKGGTVVINGAVQFGATAAGFDHIRVYRGGDVEIQSNYTVLGNTQNHWHITEGGRLTCQSKTITITGTPTMTRWMGVANSGIANVPSNTYSGSLGGGVKCLVWKGGLADIGGAGTTPLPGTGVDASNGTFGGQIY